MGKVGLDPTRGIEIFQIFHDKYDLGTLASLSIFQEKYLD